KARAEYENQRLLYVATTRAKERLVLSACIDPEKNEVKPATGSLLADLWLTSSEDFLAALAESVAAGGANPNNTDAAVLRDQALRRIDAGWHPPLGERTGWQPALPLRERDFDIEYNWAGMQARRTGTVLHRLLERAGKIGIENLSITQRERLIGKIPLLLKAMGTRSDRLEPAVDIIPDAFEQTLDSDTGRWMLSNRHREAACELSVAGLIDGQLVNAVIDRTFIDEDEVRWIIDYKSGYHAGADLESFLAEESERYQGQLHRYRQLFAQMEQRTIKAALYLPRHGKLQILEPEGEP
ncbi:MAG: PD-(D/E)XK nuclease family protein, partial [Pseudomonadales bacterium]